MAARRWLWLHRVPEQLRQAEGGGVLGITDHSSARPVLPPSPGAVGEALALGAEELCTLSDSFAGCCCHFHR